ncbi:mitochondrial 54S ribosomal protein [Saccharomycopsis crataegensis]|uniref:Large ribosomal subunit protein uL2m n=1 Tax=Saccharomycopsis crataegensis TaxID=43959 RepID=A0AAV5QFL9_9ASCO|nr:mitochondrial 54S ribosomal protein [Saccharomycopsis crataegensis]
MFRLASSIAGLTGLGRLTGLQAQSSLVRCLATTVDAPPAESINVQTIKIVPDTTDLTELERQDRIIQEKRNNGKLIKMRKYKPVSPGIRWYRAPIFEHLWKGKPYRPLTTPKKQNGGRNHSGKITVRHRGGGHKRRVRILDFQRSEPGPAEILRIEYDPNRTSHVALIKHKNSGNISYILAPDGSRSGDIIESFRAGIPKELMEEMGGKIDPAILSTRTCQKGNCLPIDMIPIGAIVHSIGASKIGPAKFCRAAGSYGRVMQKLPDKKRAIIKLKSGELRYVALDSCATLGVVSNVEHRHLKLGKAGRSRWRGWRPTVRGLAMNKCDHPHGGGRGKKKSHKLTVSPWGQLAKGYKTRRGKNINTMKVKDRPRGKEKRRAGG